jgi:hypothetical protein
MKNIRKKGYFIIVGLIAFGFVFAYSPISKADNYEPGSKDDPIVTQSYVEKRSEQLKYYIDQKIEEIKASNGGSSPVADVSAPTFEVLQMKKNERLVCGESTEIILRSGEALAVASESGGLSDVTQGKDLKMGEKVALNHLLIIPRNDGRGIKAKTDIYVMVKGNYRIQ